MKAGTLDSLDIRIRNIILKITDGEPRRVSQNFVRRCEIIVDAGGHKFRHLFHEARSRESSVGIVTGYGLEDRRVGVRVPVRAGIFFFPRRPDRLWGPPSLLSNSYQGGFPRG
jgi:hypothetical protein